MVSKQTPSLKTNSHKTKKKQHSAAKAVIESQLDGKHVRDKLRQISPVTAALVCAVILALGLSLWPYLAPFFIPSSDDRWQTKIETRLSQIRTDLQILSEQQVALTGQLQVFQNNLSGLNQKIKDTDSAIVQLSDALTTDIEKIDEQSGHLAEQLATLTSSEPKQDESAQPAENLASSDTKSEANRLLEHIPKLAIPNLSSPSVSEWWEGISDWFKGLVSVERVQPEKE